jgi:hypothetical protein
MHEQLQKQRMQTWCLQQESVAGTDGCWLDETIVVAHGSGSHRGKLGCSDSSTES